MMVLYTGDWNCSTIFLSSLLDKKCEYKRDSSFVFTLVIGTTKGLFAISLSGLTFAMVSYPAGWVLLKLQYYLGFLLDNKCEDERGSSFIFTLVIGTKGPLAISLSRFT